MSGINSNVWRRSVTRSQRAHLITEEHPHTVTDLKIIERDRAETVLALAHAHVKIGAPWDVPHARFFCSKQFVSVVSQNRESK